MQNIQDLKEKIFFESKNIIDNLDKINNVDELLSKQDLVDELANRISFLKLLEKNIEYFVTEEPAHHSDGHLVSFASGELDHHDSGNEVTEEEAIFNNELNEIDEHENDGFAGRFEEEEAVFNSQLNEIVENEFHENIVSFVEENNEEGKMEAHGGNSSKEIEEEAVFNNQLNEIDEHEFSGNQGTVFSFVDEEKILADAKPDSDEDINEEMFHDEVTEEEAIFNNQLNEIDNDDEASENEMKNEVDYASANKGKENSVTETIPSIFDTEMLEEDEMLIEENEEQFVASTASMEQGELATDTSNVENILNEIKNEHSEDLNEEGNVLTEVYDRRKIVEIDKPIPEETEKHRSDESFENEDYHQDKKIKLANIKGLKGVQTLFDDDPLERDFPKEEQSSAAKEDTGSILKSNLPTHLMEAEKQKPEFRLDLNDRIAFSKMLFEGSQADLNETVAHLNHFKTLEEAKEYLSDLYYERKWNKVDEYAQRLWILVENKFL